jgi:hypothetical protein
VPSQSNLQAIAPRDRIRRGAGRGHSPSSIPKKKRKIMK